MPLEAAAGRTVAKKREQTENENGNSKKPPNKLQGVILLIQQRTVYMMCIMGLRQTLTQAVALF